MAEGGSRKHEKVGEERQRAYEAFLILRAAGYGYYRIRRALEELVELGFLNAEVPPLWTVHSWCHRGKIPKIKNSPLVKARYSECCELAIELEERHPDWGYARIASEIRRRLGVRVPEATVRSWVAGKSRPSIIPIRMCPELGYIIGALMTDCKRSDEVVLRVTDLDFALTFREALRAATGMEYGVRWDESERRWIVRLRGSPLRYIARAGLWSAVGYCYPREFLRGAFDGDGFVEVTASKEFAASIGLASSNLKLLDFAQWLLKERYGIGARRRVDKEEGEDEIKGQRVRVKRTERIEFGGSKRNLWMLETFASEVGFSIGWKREMLEDAIRVLREHGTGRRACRKWRELGYVKLDPSKPKSRWVKPSWFLEPRYRWYHKEVPEHVKEIVGERAAPRPSGPTSFYRRVERPLAGRAGSSAEERPPRKGA